LFHLQKPQLGLFIPPYHLKRIELQASPVDSQHATVLLTAMMDIAEYMLIKLIDKR